MLRKIDEVGDYRGKYRDEGSILEKMARACKPPGRSVG
jgi:hypothetical protein